MRQCDGYTNNRIGEAQPPEMVTWMSKAAAHVHMPRRGSLGTPHWEATSHVVAISIDGLLRTVSSMALQNSYVLLVSALSLFALLFFIPKHNKVRATRVGGDPGLFGLKTLVAKFRFLVHGHSYVTARYKEVRPPEFLQVPFYHAENVHSRQRTSPITYRQRTSIA
jgi:hypothetical protein